MKLAFVGITRKQPQWLMDIGEDYKNKLSYWFQTEIRILKAKDAKKDQEGKALLDFFEPSDFVVVCDEKGKEFDSRGFSKKLESILGMGKKRMVFAIGGAYGLDENVLKRADLKLSLSEMTFNHYLALAVVLEQVYRAMTLIKGVKYHND